MIILANCGIVIDHSMNANLIKKITSPAELIHLEFWVIPICRSDVESLPVVAGIIWNVIMKLYLYLIIPICMASLLRITLSVVFGIPVKATIVL